MCGVRSEARTRELITHLKAQCDETRDILEMRHDLLLRRFGERALYAPKAPCRHCGHY